MFLTYFSFLTSLDPPIFQCFLALINVKLDSTLGFSNCITSLLFIMLFSFFPGICNAYSSAFREFVRRFWSSCNWVCIFCCSIWIRWAKFNCALANSRVFTCRSLDGLLQVRGSRVIHSVISRSLWPIRSYRVGRLGELTLCFFFLYP